jgi:hypothetical protein
VLGILAISLLAGFAVLFLFAPSEPSYAVIRDVMLRFGIIFGIVWLAVPNFRVIFDKFPPWLIAATLAGAVLGIYQPKSLPIILPLLFVLWVIGPKWFGKRSKDGRG